MSKRVDTSYTLSFDGGGARGQFSIQWLKLFVQLWGIPDTDIYKYFNIITGTSVGGIIALGLALGYSIQQMIDFFEQEAQWVFTIRTSLDIVANSNNASLPSNRPSTLQKLVILGNNDQIYRSVSTTSNYGSARLKTALTQLFGTKTMQDLKTNVIIPVYNYTKKEGLFFSNLNRPELIGRNELVLNVALATAAPPIFLPPTLLSNGILPIINPTDKLIDGGVFKNNPSSSGYTWAKVLKKRAARHCLLSIGTGIEDPALKETTSPDDPLPSTVPFADGLNSVYTYFSALKESAADDINLSVEAQYTNRNRLKYYRAQPILDGSLDTDLDNASSDFLLYLKNLAIQNFNADINRVDTFLGYLRE